MNSPITNYKVGVLIPTFNRPDLLRRCVLQILSQTRRPDIVCIHQNGTAESYQWCIEDLDCPGVWIHTPHKIPQHEWYRIPLLKLINEGCSHFFWMDHDDFYFRNHVQVSLEELSTGYDFRISKHCGVLILRDSSFHYENHVLFDEVHAPKGMSSSMAFNRNFAISLENDLASNTDFQYSDEIVANCTMPRFQCLHSKIRSTTYVSHAGSVSSPHWQNIEEIDSKFKKFHDY